MNTIRLKKLAVMLLVSASAVCLLSQPVFAQIPETGDGAGALIPIMGGLLGISAVLVIVYFVLSKKRK